MQESSFDRGHRGVLMGTALFSNEFGHEEL